MILLALMLGDGHSISALDWVGRILSCSNAGCGSGWLVGCGDNGTWVGGAVVFQVLCNSLGLLNKSWMLLSSLPLSG